MTLALDAALASSIKEVSVKQSIERSWLAKLELQLEHKSRGTRLTRSRHIGPLYVQKPFYPEGPNCAHLYLLHPPGGIVSGDHLQIEINAQQNTQALVTTPGAARIYKARIEQPLQRQSVTLNVEADAQLEWFPLETIVYNNACVELNTQVNLAGNSQYIGWEINCFGLPASKQPFVNGSFTQRYQIKQNGKPLFVDRLSINDGSCKGFLNGSAGMKGNPVCGFFIAGPFNRELSEDQRETLMDGLRFSTEQLNLESYAAISKVGELFIGRYLGESAEQSRKIFTLWWETIRPLVFNREACAPRIWST